MDVNSSPSRPLTPHDLARRGRRRLLHILVRMAADALLLISALALSYVGSYILLIDGHNIDQKQLLLARYVGLFLRSAAVVVPLGLVVFYAAGFYTHGRFYRSRYKALVVAQSVTLCFLIYGFLSFLTARAVQVPRSILLTSWALALAFLLAARLWSTLWLMVVRAEEKPSAPRDRAIRSVLVIGGAGYIGSALLRHLLGKGYRVRVLDLFVYGDEPIREFLGHPLLEVHRADFRQIDQVAEAMRDMDAVVHLGAIVGDPACALDEDLTIDVNLLATRMIAEIAKGFGVNRFIFASTCSVYGASDETLDECSALNPLSLYARSKIASERVLMAMADDRFSPVILRFGTIYGLSGRTRFDLVVNLLTAKAVTDGLITVMGGDQWRPFVHVQDAALAVLKALEAPLAVVDRQTFNVGSDDQNCTLQEVGELIQSVVPTAKLVDLGSNADRRNYRVSFRKIRHALGFEPQWTLERGVRQVKDALTSGKVRDYRLAIYNNVKFLSEEGIPRLAKRPRDWTVAVLSAEGPVDQAAIPVGWQTTVAVSRNGIATVTP